MVSNNALAIGVPLLFLITFQLTSIARETPVDTDLESKEHHPIGESNTVPYDDYTEQSMAFKMADLLPTLGRWSQGMGVFGIFHQLLTTYLFVVVTLLTYIGLTDNPLALIGAAGLAIVWLLLPFFEVKDYHKLTDKNLRPKSVDFHVTAIFFELVAVFGVAYVAAIGGGGFEFTIEFLSFSVPQILVEIVGFFLLVYFGGKLLRYHNLFYNAHFIIILSQEMKALEGEG